MQFAAKLVLGLAIAHAFWGVSFLIGRLAILALESLLRATLEGGAQTSRPAVFDLVVSTAAGIAVLTLDLFLLGTLHGFSAVYIAISVALIIAGLAALAFGTKSGVVASDLWMPIFNSVRPIPAALYALALAIAPPALLAPTAYDSTMYHLANAVNWANAGYIYTDQYLHFPLFPFNVELLFAMCYALRVGDFAQFITWVTYLCSSLSIFAGTIYLVRMLPLQRKLPIWSVEATAAIAAFSFALSPLALRYADVAYVEIPISFYVLAACLALLGSIEDFAVYGIVCGLVGGLLIGSKLQFCVFLPVLAALLLYTSKCTRARRDLIFGASLVLVVAASPWYIRNLVVTGDPFSPLLNLVVHGSDPYWSRVDLQFQNHSEEVGYASGPIPLALSSILSFVTPGQFGEFGATANVALMPLPLLLLVFFVIIPDFRKRYVPLLPLLIAYSCTLLLSYASSHAIARYTLYEYPLYLVLLGSTGLIGVAAVPWERMSAMLRGSVVPLALLLLMLPNPFSAAAYGATLPLYSTLKKNVDDPTSYLSANVEGYSETEDLVRFLRTSKVNGNVLDAGAMYLAYFFRQDSIVSVGDWIGPGRYSELIDAITNNRTADYLSKHKIVAVLIPPGQPMTPALTGRFTSQLRSQGFLDMTPLGGDVLEFVSAEVASKSASVTLMLPRAATFAAGENADFVKSFAEGRSNAPSTDAGAVTLRNWPYDLGEYRTITITSGHNLTFAIKPGGQSVLHFAAAKVLSSGSAATAAIELLDATGIRRRLEIRCDPAVDDKIIWHPVSIPLPKGTRSISFDTSSTSADLGDWIAFAYPIVTNSKILELQPRDTPAEDGALAKYSGVAFYANPNPVPVSDTQVLGSTTIHWSGVRASRVQVRIGSAGGQIFAEGGASGNASTQTWVTDGMKFFLVDAAASSSWQSIFGELSVHLCSTGGGKGEAASPRAACN